jgi:DNA-binding response OmpR family regulator
MRILLASSGYDVSTAEDGAEALSLAEEGSFDVILLDLEMPAMSGRDFFRTLRERGDKTPIVIISAFGAEAGRLELGAEGAIGKPFDPSGLPQVLERALRA